MRQYYKAAALQGMLADTQVDDTPEALVLAAANYADEMIAEDEEHANGQ